MTESSVKDSAWIRRFHPRAAVGPEPARRAGTSAATLVCFPHAGGSASFFFPVSTALRGQHEVLAVQYPGRQDRREEEPIGSLPVLADRAFAALRPWFAEGPVALFGHSMGAVIAFEVARRAEREAGTSPTALVASGRRAPSRHRTDNLHQRDDNAIVAELRKLNGTDASLLADDEIVRMILPAVRGDYRAVETYVYEPGPPLRCPITAFIGDDDPQVTVEDAEAWAAHTTAGFRLRVFRGGHFYLTARADETIAELVRVLKH
jgi:surfactin synthase thioesterase subunit